MDRGPSTKQVMARDGPVRRLARALVRDNDPDRID
jgi:hypothetical protein